jgi:hypothetical protein
MAFMSYAGCGFSSAAMSLMQIESHPRSRSLSAISTKSPGVCSGLTVQQMVPCACFPVRRTAAMERRRFRMSFKASRRTSSVTSIVFGIVDSARNCLTTRQDKAPLPANLAFEPKPRAMRKTSFHFVIRSLLAKEPTFN